MNEKKLYKSRDDKYIGGVCGGIGEYFEIDSTIIRLATVLLSFATSGVLVLIYILLCFLIPYEPITPYNFNKYGSSSTQNSNNSNNSNTNSNSENNAYKTTEEKESKEGRGQKNLGIFLVIIGFILFLSKVLPYVLSKFIVPIGILLAGVLLIFSASPSKKVDKNENKKDCEENNETFTSDKEEKTSDVKEEVKEEETKTDEVIYMGTSDEEIKEKDDNVIEVNEDEKGEFIVGEEIISGEGEDKNE